MSRMISLLGCYSAKPAKSNFHTPYVSVTSRPFGVVPGIISSATSTSVASGEIYPDPDPGGSLFVNPYAIDGRNYGVVGADYLSPAFESPNYPGHWSVNFNLVIPFNPSPNAAPPPGVLTTTFIAVPGMQPLAFGVAGGVDVGILDFPWPMPLVNDKYTFWGMKCVDQFNQPYPAFDYGDGLDHPHYKFLGPLSYAGTGGTPPGGFGAIGGPLFFGDHVGVGVGISCSMVHELPSSLFIADASTSRSNKRLCYPNFTWDAARMAAVAAWFSQWPCKLLYRNGAANIIVDGTLGIDPNKICYGPISFALNRPPCKNFGILNPC